MSATNNLKFSKRGKSLSEMVPEIAAVWDNDRNGSLIPEMVSFGSHKKAWWKCPTCKESWQAAISVITSNYRRGRDGIGCPYCAGKRVSSKNSLGTLHPDLVKEWDTEKNGKLSPFDVLPGANKKVWWICPQNHSYQSPPHSRTGSDAKGCPVCAGKVVIPETSLASLYPELSQQWHPTKNGRLTPSAVTPGSNKKIWWQCNAGHEWQSPPHARTGQGSGCPICAGVSTSRLEMRLYTELKSLFPDTLWRNRTFGFELDIYIPSLSVGVEADGSYWHMDKSDKELEKNTKAENHGLHLIRIREFPLKKVSSWDIECGQSEDELLIIHRLLDVIESIIKSTSLNDTIANYKNSDTFSDDAGYRKLAANLPAPPYENSLANLYPGLVDEWHFEKNMPLTPEMFMPKSNQKVWWKCNKCGHEYLSLISTHTSGSICPKCANKIRGKKRARPIDGQSLAILEPKIAAIWDKELNGSLTPNDVSRASGKKVWWRCEAKHDFQMVISKRSMGRNCPKCSHQCNPSKPTGPKPL